MITPLVRALDFLVSKSNHAQFKRYTLEWLEDTEISFQVDLLRVLLCIRDPTTQLPTEINKSIDEFLQFQLNSKLLTDARTLAPKFNLNNKIISVWKGDITTLSNVTAIVNAANSQMLGCFQPSHRCIDNVIHSAAGPGLRDACYKLMEEQDFRDEPVGTAKITPGFNLLAKYVLHTVGPQIRRGEIPTNVEISQLRQCYLSCLNQLEKLDDKDKSIVFPCISTGLFSFPADLACEIAIDTITEYFSHNSQSSISEVIFNVFTEDDWDLYDNKIKSLKLPQVVTPIKASPETSGNFQIAKSWLKSSKYLIISAGAGLSATVGLDYTSQELFDEHYTNFKKYDLDRLYATIGHNWPNHLIAWSYYFHHYDYISKFPKTQTYQQLLNLTEQYDDYFVATTNADGFFFKNDFDLHKVFNPQGSYDWIQCSNKCTPDSYTRFGPIVEKVKPFIDPKTNLLPDESYIPHCDRCGAEMILCLRGGNYFNDKPFTAGKLGYKSFLNKIIKENAQATIIELGVGLNTPSVLRWPNEELVTNHPINFKLIRVGYGPSGSIPLELFNEDKATVIQGEISSVVDKLCN
ncbi:uncharacterized protein RJT21DRAFT_125282 [Scheffersomyces amazonensis]|uniref:uncharacterized protein n=1 Tax=Scheffersomyces amazonensis TaxID=1078765 RepID=UPI00315DD6EC